MCCSDYIPQLSQCCCGCQLRTGSKFVGWFATIVGTLGFIFYLAIAIGLPILNNESDTPLSPQQVKYLKISSIIVAVLCLVRVLFAVLLLIGVYKGRVSFYLPWIIYTIVDVALGLSMISMQMRTHHALTPEHIGILIGACIQMYFTWVIYSDYRDRKESNNGGK